MPLGKSFFEHLEKVVPQPKRTRPPGSYRFSPAEVEAIYAHRKRGLSWEQINAALLDAGEENYARPQSLAQTIGNAAKHYGIANPFPGVPRKPKADAPAA